VKDEMSVRTVYSLARDRAKRSEFTDEGPFCAWLESWRTRVTCGRGSCRARRGAAGSSGSVGGSSGRRQSFHRFE